MMPALRELCVEEYARSILPLTQPLWGNGRELATYAAHTTALAQTAYGKRYYRIYTLDGPSGEPVASFKRYERSARLGNQKLRAAGIGAVFTPENARGRGYASAMLGLALDEARGAGFDFAYLFSDIHPAFYKELGFAELPSRAISVRADTLASARIAIEPLAQRDWSGIRRCFEATQTLRDWGLERSPVVWDWLRRRLHQGSEHGRGQPVHLVVRRARSIAAYVLGQREPQHDAYVLDEFGFIDDPASALVPSLLRCAAGDLRRIAGWLPPGGARELLPRGSVRRRGDAIWMIAALNDAGARFLNAAKRSGAADGVWSLDHI